MTFGTTTLNPGTGGSQMLDDSITTLNGGAAPSGARAQIHKLAFGTENNARTVDESNPYPTRVSAFNYPISAANSSTTQLTAGASFTGAIESAQDQPSLSILMTSDQPMTVTVRQFIDAGGTFAAPDIVFYVAAGAGFARSLTINGNFCQVIAQNTGGATTTTFNLNCAFGALGDSDSTGTMPVTELPLLLTGAAAQTAVVNNILMPTAGAAGTGASGYRAASVQVVSTGTAGTFIFEQSNDGTNWAALPVFNAALVTGVPITAAITATASAIVYTFPIRCAFLRLRIATTITGGSIRAFSRLSTEPWTAAAQLVASNAAANLLAQVSGSVTATGVAGAAAHDAAVSGNPVRLAGRALTANYAAVASGDVADLVTTLVGALIQKPFALPESDWTYAAAAGGIVNTTDVPVKAAAAAGIRNYVTAAQVRNASAVATEFVIKDGASTVLWRCQLPANMPGDLVVQFPNPLRGTAATAVNVACITTGAAVYANLQGYIAP